MVRLLLAVPVFFLVLFSIIPVFADTSSITVVSGKTFTIDYTSVGIKITDAQVDQSLGELLFTVQVLQNGATLQITLPRELIDSKNNNGTDSDFLVVVDGVLTKPQETYTSTSRILQFTNLTTDEKEIDIIGTYIASSTTVAPTPPAPSVPVPQEQNQTSQSPKPQPTPSTPVPQPTVPPIQANATQKTFIQQNFDNLVTKIPYISSFFTKLSMIDYAVIGSIVVVVVIVIASVARTKSRKLTQR